MNRMNPSVEDRMINATPHVLEPGHVMQFITVKLKNGEVALPVSHDMDYYSAFVELIYNDDPTPRNKAFLDWMRHCKNAKNTDDGLLSLHAVSEFSSKVSLTEEI